MEFVILQSSEKFKASFLRKVEFSKLVLFIKLILVNVTVTFTNKI